jgi:hypothetical protein
MRLVQTLHRNVGRLDEHHGLKLSIAHPGHLWSLANATMTAAYPLCKLIV